MNYNLDIATIARCDLNSKAGLRMKENQLIIRKHLSRIDKMTTKKKVNKICCFGSFICVVDTIITIKIKQKRRIQ